MIEIVSIRSKWPWSSSSSSFFVVVDGDSLFFFSLSLSFPPLKQYWMFMDSNEFFLCCFSLSQSFYSYIMMMSTKYSIMVMNNMRSSNQNPRPSNSVGGVDHDDDDDRGWWTLFFFFFNFNFIFFLFFFDFFKTS